ncbi:MAG: V-type ATP synthase subunit I [Patescibacteria group bacterium]
MAAVSGNVIHIHLPEKQMLSVSKFLTIKGVFEPIQPLESFSSVEHSNTINSLYQTQKEYQVILQHLRDLGVISSGSAAEPIDISKVKHMKVMEELKSDIEKHANLEKRITEYQDELRILSFFEDLDEPFHLSSELVSIAPFITSKEQYRKIILTLSSSPNGEIIPLFEDDETVTALILYIDSAKERITELLKETQAEVITMKYVSIDKTPQEELKRMKKELQEYNEEKTEIMKSIKEKTESNRTIILSIVQYLGFEIQSYEMLPYFTNSDKEGMIVISGWIDKNSLESLETELKNIDKKIFIEVEDEIDIEPKVALSNNAVSKPFEEITKLIGVPSRMELDPTPFMTPFFIIFFGFALGDGGYGLLMLVVAAYVKFTKRLTALQKNMMNLISYCAASTIFFGALTGSWFGVVPTNIPGAVGSALQAVHVVDLQKSVITVLIITLLAGLFQQILGVLLQAAVYIKQKAYADVFWRTGTVLMLMILVGLLAVGSRIPAIQPIQQYIPALIGLNLVLFLYGHGRSAKNIFARPFAGLINVFDLIGYVSNTLSYARILAMGLATGVIAGVINIIANLFGGDGFFGIIVTILILIVGHLFNLVLNLLGTFVNITRLQLVEFFPRFFEAKGEEITPTATGFIFEDHRNEQEAIQFTFHSLIGSKV